MHKLRINTWIILLLIAAAFNVYAQSETNDEALGPCAQFETLSPSGDQLVDQLLTFLKVESCRR